MLSKLFLISIILEISFSINFYEDENFEKMSLYKNLNCEDFSTFIKNCTMEAAMMYNYTKKSPPIPAKINNWCRAIRHLTNCGLDWNSQCKARTENNFNDAGINGHMYVVNNVCDDEWFLSQYDTLTRCIEVSSAAWEACYKPFKEIVDGQMTSPHEWTHYITHFHLCCARTRFRRCTLDALFSSTSKCLHQSAIYLQKFSVILSEGDVFQECDHYMLYENCPGGDPRPSGRKLVNLMNADNFHPDVPDDINNTANVFKSVCSLLYALMLCMCLVK